MVRYVLIIPFAYKRTCDIRAFLGFVKRSKVVGWGRGGRYRATFLPTARKYVVW